MKNILKLVALLVFLAFSSEAQVSKAQIDKLIKEVGTDLKTCKVQYVNFLMGNSEDNTIEKYCIADNLKTGGRELTITDAGLEIRYFEGGSVTYINFIPFSDIKRVSVGKNIIVVILNE